MWCKTGSDYLWEGWKVWTNVTFHLFKCNLRNLILEYVAELTLFISFTWQANYRGRQAATTTNVTSRHDVLCSAFLFLWWERLKRPVRILLLNIPRLTELQTQKFPTIRYEFFPGLQYHMRTSHRASASLALASISVYRVSYHQIVLCGSPIKVKNLQTQEKRVRRWLVQADTQLNHCTKMKHYPTELFTE